MEELIANIHIHTRNSDGKRLHCEIAEDAIKAGIDVILISDDNMFVNEFEEYYTYIWKECFRPCVCGDP